MASRGDLVRKILKALGVWQAGQDLPPEDYMAVDQELPTKLLAMSKANVFEATVDYIPDEAVDDIAVYLAYGYTLDFGIFGEELAELRNRALGQDENGGAKKALKYLRVSGATYAPTQAHYF